MSLSKISSATVIKNQFQYKLKAYMGVFTSLVMLQVVAFLLSLGGNGGGMSSGQGLEINDTYYGIFNVIAFTMLWGFIQSILMTTKTSWEDSFPFVGNRFTNDISNILFLFLASLIAGIFTVLTAFTLRVVIYYFLDVKILAGNNFLLTGAEVGIGILTLTLHLFVFCSMGYLLGTITRMHRLMPILLPVIIVGIIIALVQANSDLILRYITFYFEETNPWLFMIKTVFTSLILFATAILISSRTEVRK
ncbi:hypothetical protein [Oceanobacillus sp. CAU 1775]